MGAECVLVVNATAKYLLQKAKKAFAKDYKPSDTSETMLEEIRKEKQLIDKVCASSPEIRAAWSSAENEGSHAERVLSSLVARSNVPRVLNGYQGPRLLHR